MFIHLFEIINTSLTLIKAFIEEVFNQSFVFDAQIKYLQVNYIRSASLFIH